MSFLVTGDLHLNTNPRDRYRHEFQKQLNTLARQFDVEGIIILGDLTDDADWHPAVLVNQIVEYLYHLSKHCPVIIPMGNHDYTSLAGSDTPYFSFVSRLQRVFWIGSPRATPHPKDPMSNVVRGLGNVLWLPHTPNYTRDWAEINLKEDWDWIFTHNTFTGARDHGHVLEGIPTDVFKPKARVISGDVHVPQTIGPVTYCGAPYLVKFGDDYTPRLLLLENDRMRSVTCTGPQKRLVSLIYKKAPKRVPANRGDIVKIEVLLEPDEVARWSEIKDHIRSLAEEQGLHVYLIQPVVNTPERRMSKRVTQSPKSDKELVEAYARANKLDAPTLKVGLELLK